MPTAPDLSDLIAKSIAKVNAMTATEKAEMLRQQAESWARAEASWPKPKFTARRGARRSEEETMADDFERLCNAAYESGRRHHVAYGGAAVSIEGIRAIMVGALREQALLAFGLGHITAGNFINALIAQADGGKR